MSSTEIDYQNVMKEIWEMQNGPMPEVLILDAHAETPLNHSVNPTEKGRFISAKDGSRYMVAGFDKGNIIVRQQAIKEVNWSEDALMSPTDWVNHKMKGIVFTDGQELRPLIEKNGDEVVNIEYVPYYRLITSMPSKVMVDGVIYSAEYKQLT